MILSASCVDRDPANVSTGDGAGGSSEAVPGSSTSGAGSSTEVEDDDDDDDDGATSGESGSDETTAGPSDPEPPPPTWSESCLDGIDGDPLVAETAASLLFRLDDELAHHVERVREHAATLETPGSHDFDYDESGDNEVMTATGVVTTEDGTIEALHRVRFECYTGGHGGFGPSAVDGLLDVTIEVPPGRANTYVITVLGEVRLGGGEALSPSVPALADYTVNAVDGQWTYSGMLGAFDVNTL